MLKKIFFLILLSAFFLGCVSSNNQKGFLQGKISIGPVCPVEKNPPDPNCLATEQTYLAYPLSVYSTVGGISTKVLEFHGDKNGFYRIELPAGFYEIKLEKGLRNFSKNVEIKANETTILDIEIDTGIR